MVAADAGTQQESQAAPEVILTGSGLGFRVYHP